MIPKVIATSSPFSPTTTARLSYPLTSSDLSNVVSLCSSRHSSELERLCFTQTRCMNISIVFRSLFYSQFIQLSILTSIFGSSLYDDSECFSGLQNLARYGSRVTWRKKKMLARSRHSRAVPRLVWPVTVPVDQLERHESLDMESILLHVKRLEATSACDYVGRYVLSALSWYVHAVRGNQLKISNLME